MTKQKLLESALRELIDKSAADRSFEVIESEKFHGYLITNYLVRIPLKSTKIHDVSFEDKKSKRTGTKSWKALLSINNLSYEEIVFLDLETHGLLRNVPIFMAGTLFPGSEYSRATQFIAKTENKEKRLLKWVTETIRDKTVITFNGSAFDLPFLKGRCEFHSVPFFEPSLHVDLLPYARELWKDVLSSRKLKVLECNINDYNREFDIPSSMIPSLIKQYENTGNMMFLDIVARHNLYDLIATVKLFEKIISMFIRSI